MNCLHSFLNLTLKTKYAVIPYMHYNPNNMLYTKRLLLLIIILINPAMPIVFAQQKKVAEKSHDILRRKDSFFGLHFDFHAGLNDAHIGRTLTEGMIDTLLSEVHPDFIQVDCKGHPGISSYPTKVGTPGTSFDKDPLKLWRAVTRKYGVALYVHYSGVYDIEAVKIHPEWAAMDAAGKTDQDKTSVFGAYADQLLIPQMKELSKEYGIDGIWVDGDCWGAVPDYSPAALAAFKKATGIVTVPKLRTDEGYAQFLDFNRQAFLDYVQKYASAIHLFNPDFQVASNWAFSSFIPRPVNVDVDFLSGDLTPVNSLNNAAFEGRCLSSQSLASGKPWDIMSWSFTLNWKTGMQTQKSAVQLQQEAAEIISMGGGFQTYFTQNRDASVKTWQIPSMKALANFVQSRSVFCKNAIPIPQVAVLYSGSAHERNIHQLFTNGALDQISGITSALLDGQQAVEIKMEHHLHGTMNKYPLIVVPEWDWLPDSFRTELLQYASAGGKLLVIGAKSTRLFASEAGLSPGVSANGNMQADTVVVDKLQYLNYNGIFAGLMGDYQPVTLQKGVRAFGNLYDGQDVTTEPRPAATIATYGKGQIACVPVDMGENYRNNGSFLERDFLNGLVAELFANPIVQVTGSKLVHVAVNRLGAKTIIHLTNTAGQHAVKEIFSYDEVPAIGPLTVQVQMKKPSTVMLQPENKPLPYVYANGKVIVKISSLKIHSMIVAE
jgi:hypothetical protein